jgi:hypothetical protein
LWKNNAGTRRGADSEDEDEDEDGIIFVAEVAEEQLPMADRHLDS